MRRFAALATIFLAGAAAAMLATLGTPVGFSLWHYNLALALLALAALPLWTLLKRRRVATLGMAYAGALASITGFFMLYTRQFPYKEWLTWWHSVTSFAFLGLFLVHWWHNQPRLLQLTARLGRALPAAGAIGGAWTAGFVAGVATWMAPDLRALFTSENYLLLSTWAIWASIALAWGLWLWHRRDAWRARLADTSYRTRARGLVDASLFLACWLSLLTGFALLYLADFLRGGDLKYVSKWWHTATSALLLALVALHVGLNARPLAAHARRMEKDLAPARGRP